MEIKDDSKNNVTDLIFKELYKVSSLSDNAEYVYGGIKKERIKIILYSYLYSYKIKDTDTWGVLTNRDIEKAECINEFYDEIINELLKLKLIKGKNTAFENEYGFTLSGYKYYWKLAKNNSKVDLFTDSKTNVLEETSCLKNIRISESKKGTLAKELMEIIYIYTSNYNKKISSDELIIRYLSSVNDEFTKYSSVYEIENSGLYDRDEIENIKEIIEREIYSIFRKDLVFYHMGYIDITPNGIKYLSGEKNIEGKEKKLSELNKQISIVHISDLHFGSNINDGIDNKDNLKGIEGLKNSLFNSFRKVVNDNLQKDGFLIVSGDLTTKNEEDGFDECLKHLSELNVNKDNIYIVPGNHDCDREEINEKVQFSKFISYFSEYNNPFVKNKYILNKKLKVFIIGFNSVHISHKDNKQELFYIEEEKIDELNKIIRELDSDIEDFNRYTKIAVVHNNIVPHPSIELKKYSDILNLYKFKYTLIQLGFKFIFSGHKHHSLIERHITYGNDLQGDLLLVSSASLCGQVVGERNGFQIIDIYKDLASDRLNKIIVKEYYSNQIGIFKEENQYEIMY